MVRKMAYVGTSYLIGLFFASFLSFVANFVASLFITIVSSSVLALYKRRYVVYLVCALSIAAAMLSYGAYDCFVYRNVIKYDGCDVEVIGIITGYADHSGDKSSYTIKGIINDDVKATVICYTDSVFADIGDSIKIIGTAESFKDSYTFSAKAYYKAKGIYLRVNNVKHLNYTENKSFSITKAFDQYRERIIKIINEEMDSSEQAVMAAMLFGDKSDLESSEKTLMYRAGIGHIMAVSGVHLSVVCSFFWLFLSRVPMNKHLRFGLLLIPIFCFMLLAGMSNSVMRASVMMILVYGASLFRRKADVFNSLGIAVIVLTIFDPFAVRDASFLLSVAGVFGTGVAAPAVIKTIEKNHKLGSAAKDVIVTICANAVIFPVSVLFFDEVSIISPISNLFLLPICEAILAGGLIVTITGGVSFIAVPVLKICNALCYMVLYASKFIGGLHFSYIPLGSNIAKFTSIAVIIIAAVVFAVSRKADIAVIFAVSVFSLAVISVNLYRIIPSSNITVAVLKDGTAVTVVIHDRKTAGVIDLNGGGRAAPAVVKYLNRNGIYQIDALIVNSNANAALPVYDKRLELFEVTSLLLPEDYKMFAGRGYLGENLFIYESMSSIEMPQYTLDFGDNGAVLISCNGADIIFYQSEFSAADGVKYSAAVRYTGTEAVSDADTEIIAAMNEKAKILAGNGQTVYIGENVKFEINTNGEIKSEIIE